MEGSESSRFGIVARKDDSDSKSFRVQVRSSIDDSSRDELFKDESSADE